MFHIKQKGPFKFYGTDLERQARHLADRILVNYYRFQATVIELSHSDVGL